MIVFKIIENEELEDFVKSFDETIDYLKKHLNIELRTYGNIIRIALSSIQIEAFDNLLERAKSNKELERALDYAGGYTIDFLGENNPKSALISLLDFLRSSFLKKNYLIDFLQKTDPKNTLLISDANDSDFLKQCIRQSKLNLITFSDIKRKSIKNKTLIFYSFNGTRDFDFISSIEADVTLILYDQEYQLYRKQLIKREQLIEEEIKSKDRSQISGLQYIPIPENPIHVSRTVDDIVNRLDSLGKRAYEGYKDESDLLLDEIDERTIYKFSTKNQIFYLDSNDTVFTETGDLRKVTNIKVGDTIRIYPKERLAENLYQVAVETEPDIFGVIEDHSRHWISILAELRKSNDAEILYQKLKQNGLRVLQNTVEGYLKSFRKFPMFNSDLRAIFKLYYSEKTESEINLILGSIIKSKTIYNSTMIALGRGLKQELKMFLKENRIGEILEKRKFDATTLQKFVSDYMPLITISHKDICDDEAEQREVFNFLINAEIHEQF